MDRLNQGALSVAVLTGVSFEASTQTSGVVALASSSALVAVEVGVGVGSDVGAGRQFVDRWHDIDGNTKLRDTSDLGCATVSALADGHFQEVLWALDSITSEEHLDRDQLWIGGGVEINRYSAVVNDFVWQTTKSKLDFPSQGFLGVVQMVDWWVHQVDWIGGEGFVQLGGEGNGERLATVVGIVQCAINIEHNLLDVDILVEGEGVADSQHISAVWAHALRAVNVAVLRIADASSGLLGVPAMVGEGLGVGKELVVDVVLVPDVAVGHVLDVFAGAVTRAVVWTGGAMARLAFVSIEALAESGRSVADTAAGTLRVGVELAVRVWLFHPRKLERANAIRAITRVMR